MTKRVLATLILLGMMLFPACAGKGREQTTEVSETVEVSSTASEAASKMSSSEDITEEQEPVSESETVTESETEPPLPQWYQFDGQSTEQIIETIDSLLDCMPYIDETLLQYYERHGLKDRDFRLDDSRIQYGQMVTNLNPETQFGIAGITITPVSGISFNQRLEEITALCNRDYGYTAVGVHCVFSDFEKAMAVADHYCEQYSGEFELEKNDNLYRSGTFSVRIPAIARDDFLIYLSEVSWGKEDRWELMVNRFYDYQDTCLNKPANCFDGRPIEEMASMVISLLECVPQPGEVEQEYFSRVPSGIPYQYKTEVNMPFWDDCINEYVCGETAGRTERKIDGTVVFTEQGAEIKIICTVCSSFERATELYERLLEYYKTKYQGVLNLKDDRTDYGWHLSYVNPLPGGAYTSRGLLALSISSSGGRNYWYIVASDYAVK